MQSLTDILTVSIGLVFIYLILSMIVSYLVEIIATWLKMRQQFLANAIQLMLNPTANELATVKQITAWVGNFFHPSPSVSTKRKTAPSKFEDPNNQVVQQFYAHPAITSISKPNDLPAYIDVNTFTNVILDLLHRYSLESPFNTVSDEIKKLLPSDLQTLTLDGLRDLLPDELKNLTYDQLKKTGANDLKEMLPTVLQNLTPEAIYKIASADYVAHLENGLRCLESINPALKATLQPIFERARLIQDTAEARLGEIITSITGWYNSTMDRASGWYKRNAQTIALIAALLVAVALNADTIDIFQSLWGSANLRQLASSVAVQYVQSHPQPAATDSSTTGTSPNQGSQPGAAQVPTIVEAVQQVQSLENAIPLPLAWDNFPAKNADGTPKDPNLWRVWFFKLVGLAITTLAISQGSSIWFQLLSKLISLRNTGIKPGENLPTAKADGQAQAKQGDGR